MDGSWNFTDYMERLCADLCARLEDLRHIDMARVAVTFAQARRRTSHGLYATITPLRFPGGACEGLRRGRRWLMPSFYGPQGQELLYILSFCVPRFLNLSLRQKLLTTLHELWHISSDFNGDLRRYAGRCRFHGNSRRQFNRRPEELLDQWLALDPPADLYELLRLNFSELEARFGKLVGQKICRPKPILLEW
jgi:hypothetical protein